MWATGGILSKRVCKKKRQMSTGELGELVAKKGSQELASKKRASERERGANARKKKREERAKARRKKRRKQLMMMDPIL